MGGPLDDLGATPMDKAADAQERPRAPASAATQLVDANEDPVSAETDAAVRAGVLAIRTAQAALKQVFEVLGVRRVICVDDAHAVVPDARDLAVAAVESGALNLALVEFVDLPGIEPIVRYNPGLLRSSAEAATALRSRWPDLPDATRATLAQAARGLLPVLSDDDVSSRTDALSDASAEAQLASLISTSCEYIPLTLRAWRSGGRNELNPRQPTVVLFDRSFPLEGGGDNDGDQELKALVKEKRRNVWCGLLTHTVEPENEVEEWRTLAVALGVPPPKFVVISKRRLLEEPDSLARMLRLTIVGPKLDRLRTLVVSARAKAHRLAAARLREMNVYTLEAAVVQSSGEEGTWEPDMLLGLASALERNAAQAALRMNPQVIKICETLRKVRIAELPPAVPDPDITMLRRLEVYDDPDQVNALSLPLQPGDIFEMAPLTPGRNAPAPRHLVLLGQACDLALRSDGERAQQPTHLELAEVRVVADGTRQPLVKENEVQLPLFDGGGRRDGIVKLSTVRLIPCIALDACVLNSDGTAVITGNGTAPSSLSGGSTKRHEELCREADVIVQKVHGWTARRLSPDEVERLVREETGIVRASQLTVGVDATSRTVRFGLKRTGRLREPWARQIMLRGAHQQTRVALEPSFLPKRYRP